MRENRTHGSEGGDGESRFRPLSALERIIITTCYCFRVSAVAYLSLAVSFHPGQNNLIRFFRRLPEKTVRLAFQNL